MNSYGYSDIASGKDLLFQGKPKPSREPKLGLMYREQPKPRGTYTFCRGLQALSQSFQNKEPMMEPMELMELSKELPKSR